MLALDWGDGQATGPREFIPPAGGMVLAGAFPAIFWRERQRGWTSRELISLEDLARINLDHGQCSGHRIGVVLSLF